MTAFDQTILQALEALFNEDEIETLTRRANLDDPSTPMAIKVIHKPTGKESDSSCASLTHPASRVDRERSQPIR